MLLDFATRQDVLDLAVLLQKLLAQNPPSAAAAPELLTLDQVADYTQFNRRTVRKWVTEGQFGLDGRKIYLSVHKYGDTLRFKRSDVEAFGLGVGVLSPAVAGQLPQPTKTKKADSKSTTRKRTPLPSTEALKVA